MGLKKRINSRTKGATFEREIAKKLSKWSGLTLRRTPMSGGWNKTGDIAPQSPEDSIHWPFNIECKKYSDWDLLELLKSSNPIMKKWWSQCLSDSEKSGKIPVLVFSRNNDKTYVMMTSNIVLDFIPIDRMIIYSIYSIFLLEDLLNVSFKDLHFNKTC